MMMRPSSHVVKKKAISAVVLRHIQTKRKKQHRDAGARLL